MIKDASEAGRNHNGGSNHSETDDSDCTDDDEEMWELDEAVDLNTVAGQHQQSIDEGQGQAGIDQIVRTFTREHPPPTYTVNAPRAKLPASVIIPQRRPHANTRGFVRAYAPVLADCGIDQETFMDFMDSFESARKTSPVFDVINIAGNAVGMVPSPIAMAVSIVAITTARTGKEVEGRHKTNNFLDQMNHELFMPHGLYCLIMKYKAGNFPDSEPMDINKVINKYSEPAGSKTKDTARNLRLKSGITHGEAEMPEAAPLIFPALEAAPDQKKSAWSKGSDFVADYYDKRARAKYGAENPNSALHVTGEEQFASRYSDPNSTANTGGILGLVSGGHLQHSARHQKRRRRFGERTGRLTSSKPQRETMRSRYGPATFVKKVITPVSGPFSRSRQSTF